MSLAIDLILGAAVLLVAAAALIGLNRIAQGPSQLDRSVAADLLIAVVVVSVGAWVVASRQWSEVGMVLMLSLLGFTAAVSIARMVTDRFVARSRYRETTKEGDSRG